MEMGKVGAWVSTNALNKEQLAELARGVEDLGYDTLWYPESTTYESLAMGSFLLANSSTLKVASGIANIYARDPFTALSARPCVRQTGRNHARLSGGDGGGGS